MTLPLVSDDLPTSQCILGYKVRVKRSDASYYLLPQLLLVEEDMEKICGSFNEAVVTEIFRMTDRN